MTRALSEYLKAATVFLGLVDKNDAASIRARQLVRNELDTADLATHTTETFSMYLVEKHAVLKQARNIRQSGECFFKFVSPKQHADA